MAETDINSSPIGTGTGAGSGTGTNSGSGMGTNSGSGMGTNIGDLSAIIPNIENTLGAYGLLIVQVFTALGAFPVPNALVSVSDDSGVIAVLETGRDGRTSALALPTPILSESFTPGTIPYALYTVDTSADGFYPVQSVDVAVYPGITSLQRVELRPVLGGTPRENTGTNFTENISPMS